MCKMEECTHLCDSQTLLHPPKTPLVGSLFMLFSLIFRLFSFSLSLSLNLSSLNNILSHSMSFPLIRNWKNSLNSSYWNREVGYTDTETATEHYPFRVFDTDSKIFPYRVSGAGPDNALNISIYFPRDELDPLCNRSARDIKFYLHAPDELPEPSHYFHIPIGKRVSVSVTPNTIITSNDLRSSFSPWRRNCYFNNERKLKFFKVYTQRHCELECVSNFTRTRCGCVKFSMPSEQTKNLFFLKNNWSRPPISAGGYWVPRLISPQSR